MKFLVYRWTAELRRVKEQLVFLFVKAQKTNYRGIKGHQAQVSFEFVQNVSKFGLQKCRQIRQLGQSSWVVGAVLFVINCSMMSFLTLSVMK